MIRKVGKKWSLIVFWACERVMMCMWFYMRCNGWFEIWWGHIIHAANCYVWRICCFVLDAIDSAKNSTRSKDSCLVTANTGSDWSVCVSVRILSWIVRLINNLCTYHTGACWQKFPWGKAFQTQIGRTVFNNVNDIEGLRFVCEINKTEVL